MAAAARSLARPDAAKRDRRSRAGAGAVARTDAPIHFVGIGGIGMSGIAELLPTSATTSAGSDPKASEITDAAREAGRAHREGHAAANVDDADVVVTSSAIQADNAEVVEARRRRDPGHPARRDARGADAAAVRHRDRRVARQDDDDVDGRAGARARRARPDGGDRREGERFRHQRAARARGLHGRRGGRERQVVPQAHADDRGDHEHRPRAHGELRHAGRILQERSSSSSTRCRSTATVWRASTTSRCARSCRITAAGIVRVRRARDRHRARHDARGIRGRGAASPHGGAPRRSSARSVRVPGATT